MSKVKDITGEHFGRLIALYRLNNYHKKRVYWLCACECGNLKEASTDNLTRGIVTSCGCRKGENHNDKNTRLYKVWQHMKGRCYCITDTSYPNYGKRGIKVCDEWKNSYLAFKSWSINNGYDDTLTIDRINVEGNYEQNNCRWVDYKTQNRNKRNNMNITINGETHCLKEWCEILNLNYDTVHKRITKYNYNIKDALEINS